MLLKKPRSPLEVYNELDDEVVNFFRVLRDPVLAAELERRARLTPFSRGEFELAKPCADDDKVERARKMAVRSYMGFSGSEAQYRSPKENGFRTPSYSVGTCISKSWQAWADNVPKLAERLMGVAIERRPALEVISEYDTHDTLFYVDPPYVHSTRNKFAAADGARAMYNYEMSDEEHEALAVALHAVQGPVVLSGYDCPLYARLYADWRKETRMAKTNKNAKKVETLWLNAAVGFEGRLL